MNLGQTAPGTAAQEPPEEVSARRLRGIRTSVIGIFIFAAIAALYFARDFLLPVVFAFFIAITLRPLVRGLSRRGIPAWATTTGLALIGSALALTATAIFSGAIIDWIANAPEIQRIFIQRLSDLKSSFESLVYLTETIQDATDPAAEPGVQEVVVKEPIFPTMLTFFAAYPVNVFIVISGSLVIAVFLMASGDLFYEKLIRVMPTLSDKKNALRIVLDVEREVSAYLISLTAINAVLAVAVGLGFWAIGMPTPHLWAMLAFILNFIPYLGPIAGMLLSAAIAIVAFPNISQALLAPAIYMLLIGLETQIVTPLVMSRRMQINAVVILLALAFWAWLWGIAGIVLAVPLLVTFRVLCNHIESLAPVGEFLSYGHAEDAAESSAAPGP